jgi:hypothetical protein
MARTSKGQWKDKYYKENFFQHVYRGLLDQLETEAANLQKLTATVENEWLKRKFQYLADRFTLLTAQASGRESSFDLSTIAMPEDATAKIPDPRHKTRG